MTASAAHRPRLLRPRRLLAVGLAAVATVMGATAAAGSVGVDGVGLGLELPADEADDRPVLHLGRTATLRLSVTNHADEPRTVRVYAVDVTEQDGAFSLGPEASADWLALDERLELEAGERATLAAPVQRHRVPDDAAYAAAVVERGTGTTVIARAARVFHVRGHDEVADFGRLVALAVLLMGAVTLGHLLRLGTPRRIRARGRQRTPASPSPPPQSTGR
jgi:hypothetical protein